MTATTEVKERPILMHARSVRGILDGRKECPVCGNTLAEKVERRSVR